ncbi:unnamed protein product, partial [Effrenium voratum]
FTLKLTFSAALTYGFPADLGSGCLFGKAPPFARFTTRRSEVAARMVRAWLVPQTNPSGPKVEVGSGLLIGRKDCCRIKITGATVSAVQCEVRWNGKRNCFELSDRSSNGTFLNGRLVLKGGEPLALEHGDQVQLTKRWQQSAALQFNFELGEPEPVKAEPDSRPPEPDSRPEPDPPDPPNPPDPPVPAVKADLERSLAELESRAAKLATQLAECVQLRPRPDAEEQEQLRAEVDAALQEAAREEGIGSAHRELIDDCHKTQESLRCALQELLAGREQLVEKRRRFQENARATRAVENRIQDLEAAKRSALQDLRLQMQGVVAEIQEQSNCLSHCLATEAERGVKRRREDLDTADTAAG